MCGARHGSRTSTSCARSATRGSRVSPLHLRRVGRVIPQRVGEVGTATNTSRSAPVQCCAAVGGPIVQVVSKHPRRLPLVLVLFECHPRSRLHSRACSRRSWSWSKSWRSWSGKYLILPGRKYAVRQCAQGMGGILERRTAQELGHQTHRQRRRAIVFSVANDVPTELSK